MATLTWPQDPKSRIVGTGIDWKQASPLSFSAPITLWKRVAQPDALRLYEDARYKPIFKMLPPEVQEVVMNIAVQADKEKAKKEEGDQRDAILAEVDEAIDEASKDGNIQAKLQGIKLKAELFQLLTKKPQEDPQITINVVTGVERGAGL